tara:strand:+ start:1340 stop:1498 length:159 start_codon:yes stop_codon:yes gene_type:complete
MIEQLEADLYNSERDLKRLQYLHGTKDCQDDILKLKGRIELLKEIINEKKGK